MKATDARMVPLTGFTAEDATRYYEAGRAAAAIGGLKRTEVAVVRIDAQRIDVTVRWRRLDGTEHARGCTFCGQSDETDVAEWIGRVVEDERRALAAAGRP